MGVNVTADPYTRIISVTTTPVDGVVDTDVKEDLYSDLKEDWLVDPVLRKLRFPIRAVGGDDLPGSKSLGSTYFLASDWKVKPYEASHRWRVNGNFYSEDGTSPFRNTDGIFQIFLEQSVSSLVDSTVQQLKEIEYASFVGGVTIDTDNGTAGTSYPVGTPVSPANNLQDAKAIASARGFDTIFIKGSLALASGNSIAFLNVAGQDRDTSSIIMEAGCITTGANLYDVALTGVCGGRMNIHRSHLSEIIGLCASGGSANITDCHLMGNIQLRSFADQTFNFTNCVGANGADEPTIDINGCSATIHFTDFAGLITLSNGTNPAQHVGLDVNSAKITLNSSITQGMYGIRGIATLTNNTLAQAGLSIDVSGMVNSDAALYKNKVYYDAANGVAGTNYPVGTFDNPVNNVADMMILARKKGLNTLHFHSNATLPSGTDVRNMIVEAHDTLLHTITLASGCLTQNTNFRDIKLKGVLGGEASFEKCYLDEMTEVEGAANLCMFDEDLYLKDSAAAHFQMTNCRSHFTAHVPFHIGACMVNCSGWTGMLKLMDKDDATMEANFGATLGHIIVDETCTAGQIYVGGTGDVVDNSGPGCTVINTISNPNVVAAAVGSRVVDAGYTADELLRMLAAVIGGNATGLDSANPVFYGQDGITVRVNATAANGARTITERNLG